MSKITRIISEAVRLIKIRSMIKSKSPPQKRTRLGGPVVMIGFFAFSTADCSPDCLGFSISYRIGRHLANNDKDDINEGETTSPDYVLVPISLEKCIIA
jgi:hypothetical protein